MPTPNPTNRREFKGAAAATTLQNAISSTDVSLLLVAANNWPTGAVGKFIITINRGLADEEKVLCDSQTGRTVAFLLANRGFDGTTAQGHAAGATVECTISAFDADEWNQHTNATTAVHGVAGAVVGTTDTQTLSGKTLTSPAVNGGVSDAASTIGGVSGTSLAADRTAWTTYTPAVTASTTNPTNLGDAAGRYKQVGKLVFWEVYIQSSNTMTVGSGVYSISLPVATVNNAGRGKMHVGTAGFTQDNSTIYQPGSCVVETAGGSTFTVWLSTTSHRMSNADWGADFVHFLIASGCYEAA